MLKKSKIIIACILSLFVVALTGTGLWLFLDAGTGGAASTTPGTQTPEETPIVYQDTNIQKFADALDKLTKVDSYYDGAAGTTYATLGEIKRAYCTNVAYAFSDARVSSESFFKIVEYLEGLTEAFAGFAGTDLEGSSIPQAYDINLDDYFDIDELKEAVNSGEIGQISTAIMNKISNLVADMKGGSLSASAEAGKIRKMIDLFFEYTGVKQEDIGKIVYYAVDKLFTTISEKKLDVEKIANETLVKQLKKGGSTEAAMDQLEALLISFAGSGSVDFSKLTDNQIVAMIEVAVDSWFTSFVAPMQESWRKMGVDKVAVSVNGIVSTTFGIFETLNNFNLNILNQTLKQFSDDINNATTEEAKEQAYVGAVESLTGLAQAKATEIRKDRVKLEDGTYTSFYIDEDMLNFVKQLENKLIPIAYLFAGSSNFGMLKIGMAGGTILETVEMVVNIVDNGLLNVLDLIGQKDNKGEYSFARQLVDVFVSRGDSGTNVLDGGRLIDLTDPLSVKAGISALIERMSAYEAFVDEQGSFGNYGDALTELSESLGNTMTAEQIEEASHLIKQSILAVMCAPVAGIIDMDIMTEIENIIGALLGDDSVVVPTKYPYGLVTGDDDSVDTRTNEFAVIVKVAMSFLGGKGTFVTTIIDEATGEKQGYELRENGLNGMLQDGSAYELIEELLNYLLILERGDDAAGEIFRSSGEVRFGEALGDRSYPYISYWMGSYPTDEKYYLYSTTDGSTFNRLSFSSSSDAVQSGYIRISASELDSEDLASWTVKRAYLRSASSYNSSYYLLNKEGNRALDEAGIFAQLMYGVYNYIGNAYFDRDTKLLEYWQENDSWSHNVYQAMASIGNKEAMLNKFYNMYKYSYYNYDSNWALSYNGNKYTPQDLMSIMDNINENVYDYGSSIYDLLEALGQFNYYVATGDYAEYRIELKEATVSGDSCPNYTISVGSDSLEFYVADENEMFGYSITKGMIESLTDNESEIGMLIGYFNVVVETLSTDAAVEYINNKGEKTAIDLSITADGEASETMINIAKMVLIRGTAFMEGIKIEGETVEELISSFANAYIAKYGTEGDFGSTVTEVENYMNQEIEEASEYLSEELVIVPLYGSFVSQVVFYFFELPQEIGGGSLRFTKVATKLLEMVLPMIIESM